MLDDLRTGFIDRDIAEAAYGVVVDDSGAVDETLTSRARERLAAAQPDLGLGPDQVHPVGASVRLTP